jgi:UDPglucose 6-dehydrogenase
MRLTVIGCGYVGVVTAACFAETGNEVVCADVDAEKVARLARNDLPLYEPGLEILVRENQAAGRLRFTADVGRAIEHGKAVIIAVGTPHEQDGAADLSQVLAVARTIAAHLNEPKVLITKSTVPVGTSVRVREEIRGLTDRPFFICANPEFLKQGDAVEDFMRPDRVIAGVDSEAARDLLEELYAPFVRSGNPILFMDIASAELTKYASNAMLASRISFMNHVAELCDRVGADVVQVRRGMAADRRIGAACLYPGPGYGGSCLPKDVKALVATARTAGMSPDLFEAIEAVNARQKALLLHRVIEALDGDVTGRTVAVWGLAFKAGTDDVRESPAIPLIEGLLAQGAAVRAHDPKAAGNARRLFGDRVTFVDDAYQALEGASALVVVTEWLQYRTPDFERIRSLMVRPVVVDGRNLYEPARMRHQGLIHRGIGRGHG